MKIQDIERDKKANEVKMESFTLGTIICRFTIPQFVIDEINTAYDEAKDLPAHNKNLAGQIKDEFKVTDILSQDTKGLFQSCFSVILYFVILYFKNGLYLIILSYNFGHNTFSLIVLFNLFENFKMSSNIKSVSKFIFLDKTNLSIGGC